MNKLCVIPFLLIACSGWAAQSDDQYAWLFDENIQPPPAALVKQEESVRAESETPGFFAQLFSKMPIPSSIRSLLERSSFQVTESFVPGPAGFKASVAFAGVLTISDSVVQARVIVVTLESGKDGYALVFNMPDEWKISRLVPAVTHLDSLSFYKPALVISTFDYDDDTRGVRVQKGANLISRTEWSTLEKPSVIEQIAHTLQKNITHVILQAHLLPASSSFTISVPSDAFVRQEILLADIIKPSPLMPQVVAQFLTTSVVKAPLLRFTLGTQLHVCDIFGSVNFSGTKAAVNIHLQATSSRAVDAWLRMQLPDGWDATTAFAQLPLAVKLTNPMLIVSTIEYEDTVIKKKVSPGVSLYAQVNLHDLPTGPVTDSLKHAFASLVPTLTAWGTISPQVNKSALLLEIPADAHKKSVQLTDIVTVDSSLPIDIVTMLKSMTIDRPTLSLDIRAKEQKLTMTGGATINESHCDVTLFVQDTLKDGRVWHIIIRMPAEWNPADTVQGLSALGKLSLERPVLIISSHDYKDAELKLAVKKGVTIVSGVDLSGPLQSMHDFLIAASSKAVVVENTGQIQLTGNIKKDVGLSEFSITIPTRIGFDFKKLYQEGHISSPPVGIEKIMLDGFSLSMGADLSEGFKSGVMVWLTTQPKPLLFHAKVTTSPVKAHIETGLEGTIQQFIVPWLSLGEVGIELDCDFKVLEAIGLPSGIGIRGQMALSDAHSTTIDLAGKAAVSARGVESFIFAGKAHELNLTQLVAFLSRVVGAEVAMSDMPALNFERIHVTVVPKESTIAGKTYTEGMSGDAQVHIFGSTGTVSLAITKTGMHSSGRLDTIDTPFIRLTGPGPDAIYGTPDDGPMFNLALGAGLLSTIFVRGALEIPPLKIKQESDIHLTPLGGHAVLTAQLFGLFAAELEFNCSLASLADGYIRGKLMQSALTSFEQSLENLAHTIALQAEQEAQTTEREARAAVQQAQKTIRADIVAQMNKTLARIDVLQGKISRKKKRCKKASTINKAIVCPKIGFELVPLAGELAAQEVYLEGLLKPGKKVSRAVLDAGGTLASAGIKMSVTTANALADMITAIGWLGGQAINIEQLTFECRVSDITGAKLPKVTIKGVFFGRQLVLKDMQLDLTNPVESLEAITLELLKVIK